MLNLIPLVNPWVNIFSYVTQEFCEEYSKELLLEKYITCLYLMICSQDTADRENFEHLQAPLSWAH